MAEDTVRVDVRTITRVVKHLCILAATRLPKDVVSALESAMKRETREDARDLIQVILDNAAVSRGEGIPICQDTGLCHVFLEIGQEVLFEGGNLYRAVQEGVSQGYKEGYLRKSVVARPLTARENTGDNTPAVIHSEIVPGKDVRITVLPKGTGSENMSAVRMLTPAQGVFGVAQFVVETVKKAGPNACPPMVIGVGVGGMMDHCAYLAKKALLRPIGERNPDPDLARLESELEETLNDLGIGPAGLGGRTTVLAVHVEEAPTHIGALPVAVNIQCHAARRASAVIGADSANMCVSMPALTLDRVESEEVCRDSWRDAIRLSAPFEDRSLLRKIRANDKVLLSGTIFTARDAAHKRMVECIRDGRELPFDVRDQVIYYAGPCPAPPGAVIGSLGPTTSSRMDPYTPALLEAGLGGMIGKGKRSPQVIKATRDAGAVYLIAVGGLGALLSKCVKKATLVAYPELGPEAVYRLEVEDFPAVVGVDTRGNDVYDCVTL